MPSFDFSSEADIVALKNAIDVTSRQIDARYDFKGTSAKVELNEKRLDHQPVQKISGNKVKQELKIKIGIETELEKKIVKLVKDSKLKVQASIQGDTVRVSGAKRDELQACIATVTKSITDFPIKFGNFRD